MKIVFLGLSITSSWGNGHATTYRALLRSLRRRGHDIAFFERDQEWYANNRDLPEPSFCDARVYQSWDGIRGTLRRELNQADVAVVGSYFPDAACGIEEVFQSNARVKAFYDIDTPITVAKLRSGDEEYLSRGQAGGFDLYFSFTGGPMLQELQNDFGVRRAVPLYCSFDEDKHRLSRREDAYSCDLSYMGTYASDRQAKLQELLCAPAQLLPDQSFIVAGPQYPGSLLWPVNVKRIVHLEPKLHAPFYCSSRLTLNLTRKEMCEAGYSPSVRLFEAAGCGTPIVSDKWNGIESFFTPNSEILLADSREDVNIYLTRLTDLELRRIARSAQERVLQEHTSNRRALEFENYVEAVASGRTTDSAATARPQMQT